jgi:hypothetical protein
VFVSGGAHAALLHQKAPAQVQVLPHLLRSPAAFAIGGVHAKRLGDGEAPHGLAVLQVRALHERDPFADHVDGVEPRLDADPMTGCCRALGFAARKVAFVELASEGQADQIG